MVLASYRNCNTRSSNGYNSWNILFSDVNPCISGRHNCDWRSSYCKITGEYSYSCPCRKGYTGVPGSCTGTIARMNMHVTYGK